MARNSYQDRLSDLRAEVGAMAETTLARYEKAVEVLETGDEQQAQRIIEGDAELNEWYLEIEHDCIELLALQQPVAGDLRFIASSFKVVTDLERIGDLATNLAAYGRDAEGDLAGQIEITPIAFAAGEMVADAMDAYEHDDADGAREVAIRDDTLDSQCKRASETLVRELMTTAVPDGEKIDVRTARTSRALLTIRDIERVGDHAVNICARTLYMIENDDELIY